jgi:hypothetical protein
MPLSLSLFFNFAIIIHIFALSLSKKHFTYDIESFSMMKRESQIHMHKRGKRREEEEERGGGERYLLGAL